MSYLVDELNKKQQEALLQTEGPVLIIAGAGSGKTKVLTHKIAYILEQNLALPWEILAITFTNKASKEMKEKVEKLIGNIAEDLWIGTFHGICLRILRKYISRIGFTSNFVIYDMSEQKTLIRQIMKDEEIDSKEFDDKKFQTAISNNKSKMIFPNEYLEKAKTSREKVYAKVYSIYNEKLKNNNALDFDDIINFTIKILKENEDARFYYANKFKYIFIDEYQDTNIAQFQLIKLFSEINKNVTAVGDNDQGIYSFRGADISNILNFEQDFKGSKVVFLEENYRSTQNILNIANNVINSGESNKKYKKNLWTRNDKGNLPTIKILDDDYGEANYIAKEIKFLKQKYGYTNLDFAILYRMSAQSRVIEDILVRENIPYSIVGGLKFYDRKEIKDSLAYLKLINNLRDNVSLIRIINEPKRGIGTTSLNKIYEIAEKNNLSMFDVLMLANEFGLNKIFLKAESFIETIQYYVNNKEEISVSDILRGVLKKSGYMEALTKDSSVEAENRLDNISELFNIINEFEQEEEDKSLNNFLASVTLSSEIDNLEEDSGKVTLMTIHSAKGLEFPNVFVVGVEEGTLPSRKSIDDGEIEEERRLCYVALTRAKENLYITLSQTRRLYGKTETKIPSRFIKHIPNEFYEGEIKENYFDFDMYSLGGNKNIGLKQYSYNKKDSRHNYDFKKIDEMSKTESKKNILNFLTNEVINKTKSNLDELRVGMEVMHKKFGKGEILSIEPENDDKILEINFEKAGKKRLMANFCKLEIIKK